MVKAKQESGGEVEQLKSFKGKLAAVPELDQTISTERNVKHNDDNNKTTQDYNKEREYNVNEIEKGIKGTCVIRSMECKE